MIEETYNILDYMQRVGLNTIGADSLARKLLHNVKKANKIDISMSPQSPNSMEFVNGQKLSIGDLVSHVTVPTLGYGLVVAESRNHPNYWIVKWCDPRYHDVGQLGIQAKYLAKVN